MAPFKLRLHNRNQMIVNELISQNMDIDDHFREEKFQKMMASPYAFYRGSNHLYWQDFYNDWRINFFGGKSTTLTWINGDAHIYNFGAYANHYGEAIFCLDDFDDSVVADYQFDLWRMAISIVLDCRENKAFGKSSQKKALKSFAKSYLKELVKHHENEVKAEKHFTSDTANGLLKKFLVKVEKKKNRKKMLDKWTVVVDGKRGFNYDNPKLEKLSAEEFESLSNELHNYRQTLQTEFNDDEFHFGVKDIARRVQAGTGSLGFDRYYLLVEGDTNSNDDDVILDVKEQNKPPLFFHMSEKERQEYIRIYPHEGERHARAFSALAEHPDRYLGWITYNDKAFSVKERSPFKSDFPTEKLKSESDLLFISEIWGYLLASRHKRASYRLNDDHSELPLAVKELVKDDKDDFRDLVVSIAFQYADCVEQDFECFLRLVEEDLVPN